MGAMDGYLIHKGQKCSQSGLAETKECDITTEKSQEAESGCFPKKAPGSSSFLPVTPWLGFCQTLGLLKLVFPIDIHKSGSHFILSPFNVDPKLLWSVRAFLTVLAPVLNLYALAFRDTHLEFTPLISATLFQNHNCPTLLARGILDKEDKDQCFSF